MTFKKKSEQPAPVEALTLEQREAALAEREAALAARENANEPKSVVESTPADLSWQAKYLADLKQWAIDNDPKNRKVPQ